MTSRAYATKAKVIHLNREQSTEADRQAFREERKRNGSGK